MDILQFLFEGLIFWNRQSGSNFFSNLFLFESECEFFSELDDDGNVDFVMNINMKLIKKGMKICFTNKHIYKIYNSLLIILNYNKKIQQINKLYSKLSFWYSHFYQSKS